MAKLFSSIMLKKPKRTSHDLSYASKMSLHMGRLCPMMLEKQVPTDKVYNQDEFLVRFAPFFGQVFQAYPLRTEYFFVPSRLLWKNFELFTARGLDGSQEFVHPYFDLKSVCAWFLTALSESYNNEFLHTLFDYFNLPTDITSVTNIASSSEDVHIDALPFYAIAKAFLDFYADENLEYMPIIQYFEAGGDFAVDGDNTSRVLHLLAILNGMFSFYAAYDADKTWLENWIDAYTTPLSFFGLGFSTTTADLLNAISPFKRSYPKDYFTSALPFAQRGPVVQIPLNGSGDIKVYSKGLEHNYVTYRGVGVKAPASTTDAEQEVTLYEYGVPDSFVAGLTASSNDYAATMIQSDNDPLEAIDALRGPSTDNTNPAITFKAVNINGTATIIDLRTAITVQNWLEKRARTGARFTETIAASFGIRSKDYRLQRSQFISAFRTTVKIGEVFTTAQDDSGDFVPGLGVSVGQLADGSRKWKKFIDEPGYTFGFISIYPTAAYYQGVPRQLLELDVFDYYWPEFQHLGEQSIYNLEVKPRSSGNFDTFGYTPRYAQYKTRLNQIHGDFRGSLNYMTAARKLDGTVNLNNKFVQVNPSADSLYRTFNATGEWQNAAPVYVDIFHHLKMVRPMSYFGNPRLI